ncbi:MAG: hypothetical protein JST94_11270 [Bacteroidetes bacterium]|nr:hypothetical protein [Bacteroidota bacterium]MBS1672006.1 hypothetical protein [Bacteroidota bacterium]
MKKIFTLALLVTVVFTVKAQNKSESKSDNKVTFGVGPALSMPSGDFSNGWSFGIGAEVQVTYHASANFEGFAQAGYSSFSGKTIGGSKVPAMGFIPVLIGARYVTDGFSFGAGLGYGSYSSSGSSSSGFTFSPQIGYSFNQIQVLANYTSTSVSGGNINFFGLKAYYNF